MSAINTAIVVVGIVIKMANKKKKTNTERQKKLIKLISDNFGSTKTTKTMYEMFLEAGFEESTARQQTEILSRIKDRLEPVVQKMTDHREKVFKQMDKKLPKAKYNHCIEAFDKLTKNIQLLSGGATSREEIEIDDEKYRAIIKRQASNY